MEGSDADARAWGGITGEASPVSLETTSRERCALSCSLCGGPVHTTSPATPGQASSGEPGRCQRRAAPFRRSGEYHSGPPRGRCSSRGGRGAAGALLGRNVVCRAPRRAGTARPCSVSADAQGGRPVDGTATEDGPQVSCSAKVAVFNSQIPAASQAGMTSWLLICQCGLPWVSLRCVCLQ